MQLHTRLSRIVLSEHQHINHRSKAAARFTWRNCHNSHSHQCDGVISDSFYVQVLYLWRTLTIVPTLRVNRRQSFISSWSSVMYPVCTRSGTWGGYQVPGYKQVEKKKSNRFTGIWNASIPITPVPDIYLHIQKCNDSLPVATWYLVPYAGIVRDMTSPFTTIARMQECILADRTDITLPDYSNSSV